MEKNIRRFTSFDDCYQSIISCIQKQYACAVQRDNCFNLALSGGRSPVGLYKRLRTNANELAINWQNVRFFWSDERYVAPTDPASNYLLAHNHLLAHIPVSENNIFKAPTDESSCFAAAQKYEIMLEQAFAAQKGKCAGDLFYPAFDLILLGMGPDGHTASLFPEHWALTATNLVVAVDCALANPPVPRLTFTLPLINNADTVIFMVNGEDKIRLLESFIDSDEKNSLIPASMVAPQRRLIWYVVD